MWKIVELLLVSEMKIHAFVKTTGVYDYIGIQLFVVLSFPSIFIPFKAFHLQRDNPTKNTGFNTMDNTTPQRYITGRKAILI